MLRLALFLVLFAAPANADPITLTIASLAASAAVTAAGLTGVTLALAQLAIGVGLIVAGQASAKRAGGQADLKRDLAGPDELTPYRFVYGHVRTYGSPAPWRVRDDILYGCLIFNSRPSQGNFTLLIDQREVTITGDPYSFTGPGASGSEWEFKDHLTFWIGLGNQTSPPKAITDEVPDLFKTTDAWRNCTVLWVRLDCGDNDKRAERWPSVPPAFQLEGDWSKVWDPRDATQSATDPATWKFSRIRSLIVLDALRNNPIRGYPLSALIIDSFIESANIDAQQVPLKAGGTERRYTCNGLLTWDESEIEDQIAPLVETGAGGMTRVGGQIGMIPGAWQAPEITITDVLDDDGLTFDVLSPGEDLATAVRAKYMSATDWEMADAGVYVVPGAQAADGGIEVIQDVSFDFVTSATQAQRLTKILALQQRMQKRIACVLPPEAFRAVGGSIIAIAWPAPYSAMNGNYRVNTIHPALDLIGDDGVAMRCPVELTEVSPSIWAWRPSEDERDVEVSEPIITSRSEMPPPSIITTTTGSAAAAPSGADRARIKFAFAPVDSARVDAYEWQFRETGSSWQSGGEIDADIRDSAGKVFGFVRPVVHGTSYDIRIRSLDGKTSASVWTVKSNTIALGPSVTLTPPIPRSAARDPSRVFLSFLLPSSDDVTGIEIWGSTSSTPGGVKLFTLSGSGGDLVSFATDQIYAYYSAKTRGPFGAVSAFSSSIASS